MNLARWAAITILSLACATALMFGLGVGKGCSTVKVITTKATTQPTSQPVKFHVRYADGTEAEGEAPGGAPVTLTHHSSALKEDRDLRGGVASAGKASGTKADLKGQAGSFNLSSFSALGGETDAKAEADISVTSTIIIGVLLFVAGVVVWWWLKMTGLGVALIIAGIGVIAIGVVLNTAPWLFIIGFVIAVGVIGFVVYSSYAHKTQAGNASAAIQAIQSIKTIGPADLPMIIDPTQAVLVQQVIDATEKAIVNKLNQINAQPTTSSDAATATSGLKSLLHL